MTGVDWVKGKGSKGKGLSLYPFPLHLFPACQKDFGRLLDD
ncbi:hypothetical protein FDUTEX481_05433 [Tolypothrix sp. PCC 7601]|nr:hypothetical protein FDUTEX481_05433 [Tolypothrix sp. PCC 7601]